MKILKYEIKNKGEYKLIIVPLKRWRIGLVEGLRDH